MNNEYIYQPTVRLTWADRFADYCRDAAGVNAPEFVSLLAAGIIMGAFLGVVALGF